MRALLYGLLSAGVLAAVGCGSSSPSAPADSGDPAADKQADEENRKAVQQQEGGRGKGKKGQPADD